jgi:hypothetical protein
VAALALLPLGAALSACGDPLGSAQFIQLDSLTLAAANGPSQLPTAVDIVINNAPSFPELPSEAGNWDVQVRMQGTTFYLVPNPGNGSFRGAGLQKTSRTLENPGDAPIKSASYTRTQVAVAPGDVFYLQSRQANSVCGTLPKYGMLKVISTQVDSGVAHLVVLSNQSCADERLKP